MEFSKSVIYGVTSLVMFSCFAGVQLAGGEYLACYCINLIVLQQRKESLSLTTCPWTLYDMFSCIRSWFASPSNGHKANISLIIK